MLVPYYIHAIEGIMTAHLDKQGMGAAAIEPHIGFILYKALLTEASSQSVCRVLWLSLAFVVEHLPRRR